MPKLIPVGDVFQIEVGTNVPGIKMVGGVDVEEGVRTGKVIALGDDWQFFGFNTFYFDSSLGNEDLLTKLRNHYESYVGKTVWWPALTERGTAVKYEDKEYVFVKCTAIMGVEQ